MSLKVSFASFLETEIPGLMVSPLAGRMLASATTLVRATNSSQSCIGEKSKTKAKTESKNRKQKQKAGS
jgi:hypothetical protein